jgi:hypothetical protein
MANNLGAIICGAKVIELRGLPNNRLNQAIRATSLKNFAQLFNITFAGFDFLTYEKTLGLRSDTVT